MLKLSEQEKEMADHNEETYENELSMEELDQVSGGWYDLPKNAPTSSNCPSCGTTCSPLKIEWGQSVDPNGPQNNNRVIGTFRCPNCDFEWDISNKIG